MNIEENKNTGDVVYQLNGLNVKIQKIQVHLTHFKKDFKSKLSLYKLVARRKKFIKYLGRTDAPRLEEFLKTSNLRVSSTKTASHKTPATKSAGKKSSKKK